jgi:PE-PPE domain
VRKPQWLAIVCAATAALAAGLATPSTAQAEEAHYYILIGGTCDGQRADVYNDAWLQGGIRKVVDYPAGGPGLPGCNQTPMDQSVAQGHERARQVVQEAYAENPDASFTIVGYSQGAIVANKVLNDIADENLGVDKSRFSAKLYADPMQPVGPPGIGVSASTPNGVGLPPELGGYRSFGPGRTDFSGIPFIRYCIFSDGVCHANTVEAAGGYFAQHFCYQHPRADGRSIMGDSIADGVYIDGSYALGKQDCRPPHPLP